MTRQPRSPRALTLRPFAKINLSLRVGPAKADGYHDVQTLLQSVALCDTLTVRPQRGAFRLTVDGPGIPADRTNLVWRAASALWRAAGRRGEPRDASLALVKSIPAAAGLGGGSSDAAAALVALDRIWRTGLARTDLTAIAAGLGADVPFFLQGGTALGIGRGDDVHPVDDIAGFGVVLITPDFGVATADAYRWLDEDRVRSGAAPAAGATSVDVGWDWRALDLTNDLQGPVARRHPAIQAMIDACLAEGAAGAAMTGSGSAVFGLFSLAAARRAAGRLRRPGWSVLSTRTLSRREAGRLLGL